MLRVRRVAGDGDEHDVIGAPALDLHRLGADEITAIAGHAEVVAFREVIAPAEQRKQHAHRHAVHAQVAPDVGGPVADRERGIGHLPEGRRQARNMSRYA